MMYDIISPHTGTLYIATLNGGGTVQQERLLIDNGGLTTAAAAATTALQLQTSGGVTTSQLPAVLYDLVVTGAATTVVNGPGTLSLTVLSGDATGSVTAAAATVLQLPVTATLGAVTLAFTGAATLSTVQSLTVGAGGTLALQDSGSTAGSAAGVYSFADVTVGSGGSVLFAQTAVSELRVSGSVSVLAGGRVHADGQGEQTRVLVDTALCKLNDERVCHRVILCLSNSHECVLAVDTVKSCNATSYVAPSLGAGKHCCKIRWQQTLLLAWLNALANATMPNCYIVYTLTN
jgi:hypothetical protein